MDNPTQTDHSTQTDELHGMDALAQVVASTHIDAAPFRMGFEVEALFVRPQDIEGATQADREERLARILADYHNSMTSDNPTVARMALLRDFDESVGAPDYSVWLLKADQTVFPPVASDLTVCKLCRMKMIVPL